MKLDLGDLFEGLGELFEALGELLFFGVGDGRRKKDGSGCGCAALLFILTVVLLFAVWHASTPHS